MKVLDLKTALGGKPGTSEIYVVIDGKHVPLAGVRTVRYNGDGPEITEAVTDPSLADKATRPE